MKKETVYDAESKTKIVSLKPIENHPEAKTRLEIVEDSIEDKIDCHANTVGYGWKQDKDVDEEWLPVAVAEADKKAFELKFEEKIQKLEVDFNNVSEVAKFLQTEKERLEAENTNIARELILRNEEIEKWRKLQEDDYKTYQQKVTGLEEEKQKLNEALGIEHSIAKGEASQHRMFADDCKRLEAELLKWKIIAKSDTIKRLEEENQKLQGELEDITDWLIDCMRVRDELRKQIEEAKQGNIALGFALEAEQNMRKEARRILNEIPDNLHADLKWREQQVYRLRIALRCNVRDASPSVTEVAPSIVEKRREEEK